MEYIVTHEGLGPCPYQLGDRITEPVRGNVQRIQTFDCGAGGTYEIEIRVDEAGDKPTGATVPTLGDMWMNLNAMYRRLGAMEERLRTVEQHQRPSVGVGGVLVDEGTMTVTPTMVWSETVGPECTRFVTFCGGEKVAEGEL